MDLGFVGLDFPASEEVQFDGNTMAKAGKNPDCVCKCLVRVMAPDVPMELPMDLTPENVLRLE